MEPEIKSASLSADQQALIAKRETEKLELKIYDHEITNDKELTEATELVSQLKVISKNMRTVKDDIIRPLNKSLFHVRQLFKIPEDRLAAAEKTIKTKIVAYHTQQEAAAAKKAEKIEKQVSTGKMDLSTGMAKLTNIKQPDEVVQAVTGSATFRITKKLRITNVSEVPAGYFMRPRVIEAIRMEVANDVLHKGIKCPAGAEVYEEKGVAVRS